MVVMVVNQAAVAGSDPSYTFQNQNPITLTVHTGAQPAANSSMDEIRQSNMFRVRLSGAYSCQSSGAGGGQPGGTIEASNWAPGEALAPLPAPFAGNTFDAHTSDPAVGDFTMHVEFSVKGDKPQDVSVAAAHFLLKKDSPYNSLSTDITFTKSVPFEERSEPQGVWYYFALLGQDAGGAVNLVWTATN